jgi:hypothetical protein
VRTAEAYLRSRQSGDGLWHPGPPPSKADALALAVPPHAAKGRTADGKTAAGPRDAGKDKADSKETEAAIWLTLRVLVVLRRIN